MTTDFIQQHPMLTGMILGFGLFVLILQTPYTDNSKYQAAMAECQKSLPRDQKCVVIAVPENTLKPSEPK